MLFSYKTGSNSMLSVKLIVVGLSICAGTVDIEMRYKIQEMRCLFRAW